MGRTSRTRTGPTLMRVIKIIKIASQAKKTFPALNLPVKALVVQTVIFNCWPLILLKFLDLSS
jgi:hypothetical protein